MSYVLFYIIMFIVLTCIFGGGEDPLTGKESRKVLFSCAVWPVFLLFIFVHIVLDGLNFTDKDDEDLNPYA